MFRMLMFVKTREIGKLLFLFQPKQEEKGGDVQVFKWQPILAAALRTFHARSSISCIPKLISGQRHSQAQKLIGKPRNTPS